MPAHTVKSPINHPRMAKGVGGGETGERIMMICSIGVKCTERHSPRSLCCVLNTKQLSSPIKANTSFLAAMSVVVTKEKGKGRGDMFL